MKNSLLVALILIPVTVLGQTYKTLDINNVSALISDGGTFFENGQTNTADYEIPKGSGNSAIYSMGFWMVGTDLSSTVHSSYSTYNGAAELAAGPIANNYSGNYYTTNFSSSIWSVTRPEINDHISNYMNAGYTVPVSIASWPGDGDPSEGVAPALAPYFDFNSNGLYDPANGDYPLIKGDEAVYVILNDENAPDVIAGPALNVEVHVMFYQFSSSDAIDNTTFFNVKVFNRSGNDYPDFKFGIFADFDLGYYQDDYWGSDSAAKYMQIYNGDNDDEAGGGAPGYGLNPPSAGIVSLSQPLASAQSYSAYQGPSTSVEYYNAMQGLQPNGTPYIHPDGHITSFQYSDDPGQPYSDAGMSNPAGDRRGLMTIQPGYLASGASNCIDFAIAYHRNNSVDNIQNAVELDSIIGYVQSYYNSNITSCDTTSLGVHEMNTKALELYPNPTDGEFRIDCSEQMTLRIYDMTGKQVKTQRLTRGTNTIYLNEAPGVYLLKASGDRSTKHSKLVIKT